MTMNKKIDGDGTNEQLVNKLKAAKCVDCACFNLRKAARAITQFYDEALRPTGLRATQFSLLTATALLGSITVTRLAEIAVMERTTLTRNLRPLEKKGLINVSRGDDQRTRVVTITQHGKEVLSKALPLWEKTQSHIVRGLGPGRWKNMRADLEEFLTLGKGRM
jgi:DNA-binding MarR family transcriptional regulator